MTNMGLYAMKKKIKNRIPFLTKFPLDMVVFKIVNGNQVVFKNSEPIRKSVNSQGDDCYIMKKTANEILAPAVGSEDAAGNLLSVQVGEGDYRFIKNIKLDDASETMVLSLHDDETMKYQFANVCKEAAFRFKPEEKWYNSFMLGLLLFGVILIIMYVVSTMAISNQLTGAVNNVISSMNSLAGSVDSLSGQMGGVVPTVARPPV